MNTMERREITVAEARRILEALEELDPLQRRVMDYTSKFSKLPAEEASRLVEELVESGLERSIAVQIANCLPGSVEELRTFLGRQRIISKETIEALLGIIEKYRSKATSE
ncbi:MAG: DNA-directed RNA polymerase, subunit F [Candidatus Bathyarchaeota archaeon B23]|nr:MAG: DNA-directed RNA polymerase, subunit F [Candidatus Bathyarchaeota archaeon B23]